MNLLNKVKVNIHLITLCCVLRKCYFFFGFFTIHLVVGRVGPDLNISRVNSKNNFFADKYCSINKKILIAHMRRLITERYLKVNVFPTGCLMGLFLTAFLGSYLKHLTSLLKTALNAYCFNTKKSGIINKMTKLRNCKSKNIPSRKF